MTCTHMVDFWRYIENITEVELSLEGFRRHEDADADVFVHFKKARTLGATLEKSPDEHRYSARS
jgi:hypothetical protein